MVSIPKVVGVLSCGFLLCLGLCTAIQAEEMKVGQSEGISGQADQKEMTIQKQEVHIIQGDVVRVECGTYFVKGEERQGSRFGIR
ncbi:MAG: hypothetical protein ABI988_18740 [Nitrospirota bacterium]